MRSDIIGAFFIIILIDFFWVFIYNIMDITNVKSLFTNFKNLFGKLI